MMTSNTLQPLGEATRQHGLLDEMSDNLLLATTPQQQLEAVMSYPVLYRATAARLYYVNSDDPNMVTLIAEWVSSPAKAFGVGSIVPLDDSWTFNPDTSLSMPRLVDNVNNYDAPQYIRDAFEQMNISAMVTLPLSNHGEWIGMIVFSWSTSQTFTDQDRRIYTRIIQISTAAIHVVRLLERTRQRSQELEIVNKELDLLYRASEAINIADTYQELIEAVAEFDPIADVVTLILWDNFDWVTAEFGTAVAVIDRRNTGSLKKGDLLPTAGFPIGDTMLGERVWIFEDAHTDPRIDPLTAQSWELLNIRAFMGPALYKGESWMGGITYHTSYPRHYTQREARLLATIGDLVSAAVQRIHLQQEREKSRTRIEILARINTKLLQSQDEIRILNALASYTQALGIYGMSLSYIQTDETTGEHHWQPIAIWHQGSAFLHESKPHPDVQTFNNDMGVLWTSNPYEVVYIEDINTDKRTVHLRHQDYITQTPVGAFMILPLVIRDNFYGMLRVIWTTPRKFSDFEKSIFDTLVRILPFVIASRRSYLAEQQRAGELERAYEDLDILYETGKNINQANSYQEILEAIAQFDAEADVISLMLWDTFDWNTCNHLEIAAVIDRTGESIFQAGTKLLKEEFPIMNVMQGELIWDFANTQTDPRGDEQSRASWKAAGMVSFTGVGLYLGEQWLGGFAFHNNYPRHFSERHKRLLVGIGDMVLGAIERIRIKQESLVVMSTNAVLEERNRLARELHDSVSQAMYGIALGARTARTMLDRDVSKILEPLDYVLQLSEAGLAEMRALIFELRPETLDKEGLVEAISRQVTMLEARHGISVQFNVQDEPYLPFNIKEAVYWIVREALHNIVKHARATDVTIQMDCRHNVLLVDVQDNGIGFDPKGEFKGHIGLQTMHERCRQVDGTLSIASEMGKGSTLSLSVPLS